MTTTASKTTNTANHTQPNWPTTVRARMPGGRVVGTDNSMWVYRSVPLEPVADAKTQIASLIPAAPINDAFEELASMASVRVARRATSRGSYRRVHMLLINVPDRYHLPNDHPLAGYLNAQFASTEVQRRVLLFGVQLRAGVGSGGLSSAINSVVETIMTKGTPLSDYDRDYETVSTALARSGMRTPTEEEFVLANSWWSTHRDPATAFVPHPGHLHVFNTIDSARAADAAGSQDCSTWPQIAGQYVLTLAAVQDFSLPFFPASTYESRWADALRTQGALAISVRGLVEPAKVTRHELRRRRKQYQDDIEERYSAGKMERGEQERLLAELTSVETAYSNGGPPTLVDSAVTVALNGSHPDLYRNSDSRAYTLTEMAYRQSAAIAEMWLASPVLANPHLHDIPVHTIAYSGMPSLSRVGDSSGAQLGVTLRDRQPAFVSHIAASRGDGLPLFVVMGQTGSGKLLPLSAPVPTPSGWTTMGELAVGDEVIGRDGKPCRVTFLSDIIESPELYDIKLSDGQVIRADLEHQWVVSSFDDRNGVRGPKWVRATRSWERAQGLVTALEKMSTEFSEAQESTVYELFELVSGRFGAELPWNNPASLALALQFVECPSRRGDSGQLRVNTHAEFVKNDPVKLFPVIETLNACVAAWNTTARGNAVRWGAGAATKILAARTVIDQAGVDEEATVSDITRRLIASGAQMSLSSKSRMAELARSAGVNWRRGVVVPLPKTCQSEVNSLLYPTDVAIKCLAVRLGQQHSVRPVSETGEQRMTTGEMLTAGLRSSVGATRFAIRLSAPLDLPEADLPIDPWLLGAWLGDGLKEAGLIAVGQQDATWTSAMIAETWPGQTYLRPQGQGDPNLRAFCLQADPARCPYGHDGGFYRQTVALRQCRECAAAREAPTPVCPVRNAPLGRLLGDLGLTNNKHIPIAYLRGSAQQRLALLQGLMDTDGTVDQNGFCALTLRDERLFLDALQLIRSLGIKASTSIGDAAIVENDPDRVGQKRPRVTGPSWSSFFTTATEVFRMPRKLERQNTEVRQTQRWLYITSITPAGSEPGRCIQVDSPDHTYLCHDFVPTSNTQVLLWLAHQFAKAGVPQVIFDPKVASNHSAAVIASGGHVASLDSLISADGVLDPMRFSPTPEKGIEPAAAMLMAVNPWGSRADDYYTPVMKALKIGVGAGATCIGQALKFAIDRDHSTKPILGAVLDLADSSPSFRACVGMEQEAPSLRLSDGITLIKVGANSLSLPPPNLARNLMSPPQRAAVNLVRMVTLGSMRALAGRDGVLHLDEAWTVLGSGTAEMDEIGRTARSQQVLPILYTQRCTDALNAGLAGYISRLLILPITDKKEAEAACALGGLEADEQRITAITAKDTVGDAPNWNSMRALRDPETGTVLRGSVGIYTDLKDRAVPVEVTIPKEFLDLASTNADDIERRLRAEGKQVEVDILA